MVHFEPLFASRGYHVYKNITWENAKVGDKVAVEIETNEYSKRVDPFCCAIKTLFNSSRKLETVGHIPREVSRHVYFFIKEEGGRVDGSVLSTSYRPSPIPSGGLEIPLILTFRSPKFITHQMMKEFMTKLYSYDYEQSNLADDSDDEEDEIHVDIGEVMEDAATEREVESDSEVVPKKRNKRKPRIVIYSESEEENSNGPEDVKSDDEREPRAIINVQDEENTIDIVVEKCL